MPTVPIVDSYAAAGTSPTKASPANRPVTANIAPLPRPSWLSQSVWPFSTSSFEMEGSRIAITDVGQGPTLLFVHTGFWSLIWRDVILRLAADFRCICFDAPGTGRSGRLPAVDISLERASRALTAVIEALDLTDVTLVVHDLGGPAGIAGAARVPDRIRGLCSINAFAWKPSGLLFRSMLALIGSPLIRELDVLTGLIPRITAGPFGIGRRMDIAARKSFLAGIGPQGIRSFHSYLRDARLSEAIYSELNEAITGSFNSLPLLTIFGERNDPFGFQPHWKKLFNNARQVVVADGNHFPMCDDPDLVATSIREFHRDRVEPYPGYSGGRP
jgi:haloalkane dehalogenase